MQGEGAGEGNPRTVLRGCFCARGSTGKLQTTAPGGWGRRAPTFLSLANFDFFVLKVSLRGL